MYTLPLCCFCNHHSSVLALASFAGGWMDGVIENTRQSMAIPAS
jgi:hypothetical protein